MIPVDFTGKVALVTGVGDNDSFAWYIAKALQAAGAHIALAVHPRMMTIVDSFLTRDMDRASRELPHVGGEFKPEKVVACDARFDAPADIDDETKNDQRFNKFGDFSIQGMVETVGKQFGGIDILIHSIAFSREITKRRLDTSRAGYFEAIGISAYSLTSMVRAAEPYMEGRPGGASVVGLTYIGGEQVVPHYGGGMSTAKAALQIDAQQLAWIVGPKNIRVNLISAGPYLSRAMKSIRPGEGEKMVEHAAKRSPLQRPVDPAEVANATAFLCSPLASGVTGQILYVDCGCHVFGL